VKSERATDDELRAFGERLRSRRTVKLFLKQPVSRKLVLEAIEAARWAPNHHVTEPWRFYLLGPEAVGKAVELTRVVTSEKKGAEVAEFKAQSAAAVPGWLVVTCRRSDDERVQQEDYASCACAIQNFMLYLSAAGAASKWSTGPITRDERFYDLLGVDRGEAFIVALIWYGYPKVIPTQSRKDVDEIVTELI